MLGKRMMWGWYAPPGRESFQDFFDYLSQQHKWEYLDQDYFVLAMEDTSSASIETVKIQAYLGVTNGYQIIQVADKNEQDS